MWWKTDDGLRRERFERALTFSKSPFETEGKEEILSDFKGAEKQDRSRGFLNRTNSQPTSKSGESETIEEEDIYTDEPWLDALTDLFFVLSSSRCLMLISLFNEKVSALSTYNESHELESPKSLVSYSGYFLVIWWIWNSQILYDIKYQTSDILCRIIKIYQLVLFATLGSYTENVDLTFPLSSDVTPQEIEASGWETLQEAQVEVDAKDADTKNALQALAIVYIISRVVLVLQYLRLQFYVYKAAPHIQKAAFLPVISSILSLVCWVVGYVLLTKSPANKSLAIARLVLWFGGIGIELAFEVVATQIRGYVRFGRTGLGERIGLFTLIILGESVISLVGVAQLVVGSGGYTASSFIQLLCSFLVVYCVWAIYFDGFGRKIQTGRLRTIWWVYVHYFVQISIVFLFSAIRSSLNTVNVTTLLGNLLGKILEQGTIFLTDPQSFDLNNADNKEITQQLGDYKFSWTGELDSWNTTVYDSAATGDEQTITSAFTSEIFRTFLRIVVAAFESFKIDLDDELLYKERGIVNNVANLTEEIATDFIADVFTESFKPTLFLLPVAGGFLLSVAVMRLNTRLPSDVWAWISMGILLSVGTILLLFAFFNIGQQRVNIDGGNTLVPYKLLEVNWLIPLVLIVYALIVIGEQIILLFAKKRYRKADSEVRPMMDSSRNDSQYDMGTQGEYHLS
ncbi:hypothetical protein BT69DRAFT_1331458 [Atractiella rhizophila]|nr:hypothetical protein BT69DRAFT_1331458 [Atractiella rhizophila]